MGSKQRSSGTSRAFDAAWTVMARRIVARNLRGLTLSCPRCGEPGALLSKWVPKTPIKPLYVVHSNGNGRLDACLLGKKQAAKARDSVRITYPDVRKTLTMGKPYVLFSGGKDSLCLLEYMRKLCANAGKELTALHVDTTAGFPEVEEYVQKTCEKLGVPLVVVRPMHDYFEIAKRWGIPGVKSRWCCETLKVAPIRRFLNGINGPKIVFDGIRAAESNIRATYVPVWYHPAFRCISVSPIFDWPDRKVEAYIEKHGLPRSPAAHLNTSAECWCGAYKCRADFEALLDIHPEIFDKLIEVEEAQRGKYTFIYENRERVRLSSLKAEH